MRALRQAQLPMSLAVLLLTLHSSTPQHGVPASSYASTGEASDGAAVADSGGLGQIVRNLGKFGCSRADRSGQASGGPVQGPLAVGLPLPQAALQRFACGGSLVLVDHIFAKLLLGKSHRRMFQQWKFPSSSWATI